MGYFFRWQKKAHKRGLDLDTFIAMKNSKQAAKLEKKANKKGMTVSQFVAYKESHTMRSTVFMVVDITMAMGVTMQNTIKNMAPVLEALAAPAVTRIN